MRARGLALGLLGLVALGIAVRLAPLLRFEVWGSDTGEYRLLAMRLLAEGRLPLAYDGWGIAYPWFPGMHAVVAGVAAVTGLPPDAVLQVLVPALAGLAGVGVALLAHALARDATAALLAGAAASVAMPVVFATSHPMPGALGHLLLLAALLLAWRAERDRAAWLGYGLVALALVATHHLSTYMLLLALGGMALLHASLPARPSPGRQRALLLALALALAPALAWWAWAEPLREHIVPAASPAGLGALAALAALGLGVLAVLPRLRAAWAWRYRPRHLGAARGLRLVALMCAVVLGGSALVGLVQVPGTTVRLAPGAVLWFLPMALLLAFGFLGSARAKFRPRGALVYGWLLALLGSFALAMAAGSTVLLPYRHAEYILEGAAVLAGLGLAAGLAHAARRGLRRPAVAGVLALLAANAALAYPPPAVLAGFEEGTLREEMDLVRWAGAGLELAPDAVVAADHRLSSMLFGYAGLDATWDYARLTFHAPTFEAAREEMASVPAPSGAKRVDYVVLTDAMRRGLALLQWEPALPLSPEAQAKFERDPHYVARCRGPGVVLYEVDWGLDGPRPAEQPCRLG